MSETVLFTKAHNGNSLAAKAFDNDSKQYIHYLATMVHSEPVVERCFEVIVANTLLKGIHCHTIDNTKQATKKFQDFINEHYARFARETIRMFFMLGFVVWRIRRIRDHQGIIQKVPEILPLGTFTWTVRTQDGNKKRKAVDDPLLYYDIQLSGIECDYSVFEYIAPDLTMQCVSPLSNVIPLFLRLQISRACKMRCEEWNAAPKMSVENIEKMQSNQLAEEGSVLNSKSINIQFDSLYEDTLGESTDARAAVIHKQLEDAGMPGNTHALVLPKNHAVRAMDGVDAPQGMPDNEMEFQRCICYAMGVPCSLVMQMYQAGHSSSTTGTSNDATTYSSQMLRNTCTRVANAICELLGEVYSAAYLAGDDAKTTKEKIAKAPMGDDVRVAFNINCTSTLELADIVELHFRKLVDDEAVEEMLLSTIGFPLNKGAQRLPWNRTVQEPSKPDAEAKHSKK